MKRKSKALLRILFLAGLLAVLALVAVRLSAPMLQPDSLGPVDGELRDCPEKPNCVCSQEDADDPDHLVAPLQADWAELVELVKADGATEVVEENAGYLWVTYQTPIMGYIDDVEFLAAGDLIHVRSASRLGRSDLGANRKRVERIRAALRVGE